MGKQEKVGMPKFLELLFKENDNIYLRIPQLGMNGLA
jgi:hypothetical protein